MTPNTITPEPNPGPSPPATGDSGRPQASAHTAPAQPDGFPVFALAVSVLAHAALIAILATAPLRLSIPGPETKVIAMRLIPRTAIEQQAPAVEDPPAARVEAEADPQPAVRPVPEAIPSTAAENPPTADAAATEESAEEPDVVRAETLRAAMLEQLRALPAETEGEGGPVLPWTSSGEPVPGVPGARGWISAYVGTVARSAQTWKENDGSSRGRYVLADGTVVCTRRRAPTIDELMNPWKSIAVTMGSFCGRERPDPPDFSDPRVQPPPSFVRMPSSDNG